MGLLLVDRSCFDIPSDNEDLGDEFEREASPYGDGSTACPLREARRHSTADENIDYEATRRKLVRYVHKRLSRADEVEDLVQDIFLRVSSRSGCDTVDNIGAYYYKTASSALCDRHRRRQVRHADDHVPFDCDRHAESDFDPARILEGRQALQAVFSAIEALPKSTRTVFLLRRLEGCAYRDIAQHLGVSVSAVEKHMARAAGRLAAVIS